MSALTPAAVLIFRYNNPDALLTLLLVASAYAFIRSLERGSLRWVTTAAILVGFGFLTKYLQAWFVLPAFALTWVVAAPGTLGRRIVGLAVAFVAVIAASGWWVAVMELIPAANRAYIGGSTNNSVLELLFGYDGLGRIFGQGGGGFGGGGGGGFSGTPGLLRLFNAQLGGQVGWLLPLALVSIGIGLVARRRFARTDLKRAAYVMWGLWLAVHVIVFSFMSGIIREPLAGQRATCPVDPATEVALASPAKAIAGLRCAATASDQAWGGRSAPPRRRAGARSGREGGRPHPC